MLLVAPLLRVSPPEAVFEVQSGVRILEVEKKNCGINYYF
jgi:hypothetical protein